MRLDWVNDWRLWFTKVSHPFDKCEQLVVRLTLNAQCECLSPRREEPFDTLTAAQEWCKANDPANKLKAVEPAAYDWRKHWQSKTRGGLEVLDVRPRTSGVGIKSLSITESDAYREVWHEVDGRNEGGVSSRDLLPVDPVASPVEAEEQRAEEKAKTGETKAKPKFCVGQKVRVIHGKGVGHIIDGSEHLCSAVHEGRIEIDGVNLTQWDDRRFEVVEETAIVPWESLAEVPLDAWFATKDCVWQRISGINKIGFGYVDIGKSSCSIKELFDDGWFYMLDPRQDPPVVHRCGKSQRKAE